MIDKGEVTYVMRDAASVWKNSATETRALSRKLTFLLHVASRPRKRESTAKKPPIRMKANMNRVR